MRRWRASQLGPDLVGSRNREIDQASSRMIGARVTHRAAPPGPLGTKKTQGLTDMFSRLFARHALIEFLLTVVLLTVATPTLAQSGRIRGTVTDEQGRPVAGATVEVATASGLSARWDAKTNENGEYITVPLRSGRYVITVAKAGVGTAQTRAVLAMGGFVTADVILSSGSAQGAEGSCGTSVPTKVFKDALVAAFADPPPLARLLRWLEAVQQHTPGCADAAAVEMGGWPRRDLEALLLDIGRLSTALQTFRELGPRDATIRLHGRRFTLDQIAAIFHGNQTLKRGAVLHADVAAFIRDDFGSRTVLVHDGRQVRDERGTVHWGFGRRLLDSVTPSPANDTGALLWYRAISAYLFRAGRFDEAPAHLDKARDVFRDRPVFLIDSAHLHLKLASPAVQAAVQELRAQGVSTIVDSRDTELERAERFLRQALALAPDDADARARLGHTLGELGRHGPAVVELRRAIDAKPDHQRRYLAELFLGRQEQALGRREEARRRFENAAALYPTAQSPWLALSQLARQAGDRRSALRALQRVTTRPSSDVSADDPWWFYYEPHLGDAEGLMDQMRKIVNADAR
jgi:tetratricopeptide (TPR) repeat protein